MTWREWSDWFIELYAVPDDKAGTVAVWVRDLFVPCGLTPEQLHAAALVVARDGEAKFLGDVRTALLDAVRQQMADGIAARDLQERATSEVGPGPCRYCGGTGMADVPHHPQPAHAVAKGYLATHLVACKCIAGVRVGTLCRSRKGEPLMGLEAYERGNPGWFEQRRAYETQAAAEGKVKAATKGWDEAEAAVIRNAENARRKQR